MTAQMVLSRFPSNPQIIRVPFFLTFGFNKQTHQKNGQTGNTEELGPARCSTLLHMKATKKAPGDWVRVLKLEVYLGVLLSVQLNLRGGSRKLNCPNETVCKYNSK